METIGQLDSASGRSFRERSVAAALLIAITLFASALRLWHSGESLWLDELHTAWTVGGGLADLPRRAALGNQSPLYFLLPWAATQVLGLNELALRLPSLVAGTLLVPLLYGLVVRWTGSHAGGLLAAFLAAIDPHFLFFSLEARSYALVQLTGVAHVMLFWDLLERPIWRRHAAFVALGVLLFYLHYTAIVLLASEALFVLIAPWLLGERLKYRWFHWLCDAAIVGVCLLPAAGQLIEIAARRDNWAAFVPTPSAGDLLQLFPAGAYFGVAGPALIVSLLLRRTREDGQPPMDGRRRAAQLILGGLWWLVPPCLALFATRLEIAALWMRRYVVVSAAAPVALAGLLCANVPRRPLRVAVAAIAALTAAVWIGPQWPWQSDGRLVVRSQQDWRAAVAWINSSKQPARLPVLVRSGLIETDELRTSRDAALREYALLPVTSMYRLQPEERLLIPLPMTRPGELHPGDVQALARSSGLWVISPGNEKTRDITVKQLRRTLVQHGVIARLEEQKSFGTVWVVRMRLKDAASRAPHPEEAGAAASNSVPTET